MKLNMLNKDDLLLLKKGLNYVKPYKFKGFILFVCILSGIVITLIQPILWAKLLTNLYKENYQGIIYFIGYIGILYFFTLITTSLQSYLFTYINNNMTFDLQNDLFDRILYLKVKVFDEMTVGNLTSRLYNDVNDVVSVITNQLLSLIIDVLKVIIIGIAIFKINVWLSFLVLAIFPFSYITSVKAGAELRKKNIYLKKINDEYYSMTQQSISGIRDIKSMGIKEKYKSKFESISGKIKNGLINVTIFNIFFQGLMSIINFSMEIGIFSIGGYFIYKKSLSIEAFIAFTSYFKQFSQSLMNLIKINPSLQKVIVSLQRIFGLIDDFDKSHEVFGVENVEEVYGDIEFKDVSYGYKSDEVVLDDISFHIPKNKKTAIVGKNGSGKSTIFNLLLRFYDPCKGKILIDELDISEMDEISLRNNITVIRQEPFLFNISIKENLLLTSPYASDEEIYSVCKMAYIHDFIMDLPDKYDTLIGENGINFSGGQKQRIAIARALLKNAKIILFDEATSSLDSESERHVNIALNEISKNHTVVIIAHRLSTILDSDKLLIIDDGKIVEEGTHQSLIQKGSIYSKLYNVSSS